MARPKKEKPSAPAEDKAINVPYKDFMNMQNATAHALTIYHSMATNAMQATSAQLSAINAAMLHTQDATREHLKKNQLDADTLDLTEYSAIAHILGMDRDAINPMGNVLNFPPSFASVPKPAETKAKRERKPKVPRDPNAPKRPLTGYLFYYTENKDALHARLNKEAGGDVPKGKVQEEGKNVWNAMPEAEKESWKARYRAKWDEYLLELKEYQAKGGVVDPALLGAHPDQVGNGEEEEEEEEDDEEEVAPKASAAVANQDDDDDDDDDDEEDSDDDGEEEAKEPTPPPKKAAAKPKTKAADKKEEAATASAKKKKNAAPAAAELPAVPTTPSAKKGKKAAAKAETPATVDEPASKKRKAAAAPKDDAETPNAKKSKKAKAKGDEDKVERKKKRKSGEYGDDY